MGLVKAALGAAGGILADQWKDYFYCEALPEDVLAVKGWKRVSGRSSNTKDEDNIISNGSVIAVADGQCMLIVHQGKIMDVCAEPGEYIFDEGGEPTIFGEGIFEEKAMDSLKSALERFQFGGIPGKDIRVYYFNTKELVGNKYGTANPVPFRVVDNNIGLDMDIAIRCFGEYSYKIVNPILFYTNVSGNVQGAYLRESIDGQLKSEVLTALQPAFAKISEMGIRYSALPGHTAELAQALNDILSAKWRDLRGLEIVSFGVSSVNASKEDEQIIKDLQKSAVMRDPTMAAATLVGAQADAMRSAAANEGAGPAMAFMGMNMAGGAGGMNAQNLFNMGQQQQPAQPAGEPAAAAAQAGWTCACGKGENTGKFCSECGSAQPAAAGWNCECGAVNKGKFCSECGKAKPAAVPQYQCDKCGWEPEDMTKLPKFCPECGDTFDDGDIK